jgi:hypothetical protein
MKRRTQLGQIASEHLMHINRTGYIYLWVGTSIHSSQIKMLIAEDTHILKYFRGQGLGGVSQGLIIHVNVALP